MNIQLSDSEKFPLFLIKVNCELTLIEIDIIIFSYLAKTGSVGPVEQQIKLLEKVSKF